MVKRTFTIEHRKRISETKKGKPSYIRTEEHKKLMSKKLKGRFVSEETKKKISKALKNNPKIVGNQYWKLRDGKKLKQKMMLGMTEEVRRGISETLKEKWKNPKFKEYMLKCLFTKKRPTSYEKRIINIINKYNLPYKYVGDGSFLIGYKNPDFININGKKICIEVFYSFYKNISYGNVKNYKEKRNKLFSKHGWETIFIQDVDKLKEGEILDLIKNNEKT